MHLDIRVPQRWTAVFIAALCLALPLTAWAGLSKKDKKRIQGELLKALQAQDMSGVAGAIKQLGQDDSTKTVKLIAKVCDKTKGAGEVVSAARDAFSSMSSSASLKEQRKLAKKAKDWNTRAMIVGLCGERGKDKDIETVIKAVSDKNAVVATNAIRVLCSKRIEKGVGPMIDAMEKLDKSKAPPWSELRLSLGELFGKTLDAGPDFRSYWTVLQGKGGLKAVSDEDREKQRVATGGGGKRVESTAVKLFGSEISCTRVVFILDVSGSMKTIDPSDGSASGPIGSVPQGGSGNSQSPKVDPRYRIERAKRELKRVVKALPESYHINIIAYSSDVRLWKPKGLIKLNQKAKTEAIAFVDQFKAYGVTATDAALRRAFKVTGARCFYLLSDGKPSMGQGADIPLDQIYSLVDEENKVLKIRINTLGFRGADQTFMRELAKRTGGTYSDIK